MLFLVLFVTFLFVNQIFPEWLHGFAPNSQARRVWSLARTSLNVKVKGQGTKKHAMHSHQPPAPRQRMNGPFCCMTHCNALAANNVTQQQMGPFRRCQKVIPSAFVWFMFGKTSLAPVSF